MIIFENKGFETRSDKPNEDWTEQAKFIVEDGTELANKILEHAPYFDEVLDENGKLVDIIPTERPVIPEREQEPNMDDYLLDLEYRIAVLELGGLS